MKDEGNFKWNITDAFIHIEQKPQLIAWNFSKIQLKIKIPNMGVKP